MLNDNHRRAFANWQCIRIRLGLAHISLYKVHGSGVIWLAQQGYLSAADPPHLRMGGAQNAFFCLVLAFGTRLALQLVIGCCSMEWDSGVTWVESAEWETWSKRVSVRSLLVTLSSSRTLSEEDLINEIEIPVSGHIESPHHPTYIEIG